MLARFACGCARTRTHLYVIWLFCLILKSLYLQVTIKASGPLYAKSACAHFNIKFIYNYFIMARGYILRGGSWRMKRNGSQRRSFKSFKRGSAWVMRTQRMKRRRRAAVHIINQSARGFTGIEVKFYDQGLVNGSLGTATDATAGEHDPSATIMMNTVTQGDGESQRDGRRITMKSIYVLGNVGIAAKAAQSAADASCIIFVALVMDTQTNGATLASENVFINPSGSVIMGSQPFRNLQFTKRFKVLATRSFSMANPSIANATSFSSDTGVIQSGLNKTFKMFVNLNTVVNYTGTTETVANIADNSLHLIAWTTSTQLAPLLTYSSRLRFVG